MDSEHNAIFQALGGRDLRDDRAHDDHGLGRPVPPLERRADRRGDARRGARPSQLGDGPERSPSIRRRLMNKGLELIEAHHLFDTPAGTSRRRRPSAVDRPRPRRLRRRLADRRPRLARHAHADRPLPRLSRADRLRRRRPRSRRAGEADLRAGRSRPFPGNGAGDGGARRGRRALRPRSTPPTKSRSPPFSTAASASAMIAAARRADARGHARRRARSPPRRRLPRPWRLTISREIGPPALLA